MPYIADRFNDTNGVAITAHTMDSGAGWIPRLNSFEIRNNKASTLGNTSLPCMITVESGWSDVSIQADFTGPDTGNRDLGLVIRYVDDSNYWRVVFQNAGNGFRIYKKIAGVETLVTFANPPGIPPGTLFSLNVVANGAYITATMGNFTISTSTATQLATSTVHGILSQSRSTINSAQSTVDNFIAWPGAGAMPVNPLYPLVLTMPQAYRVYQRNSNNFANISISGQVTNAQPVEGRWGSSGMWTDLAVDGSGNFSGTLTNQSVGTNTLAVRVKADTAQSISAASVSVGDVFVIAGQSNASGQGGATLNSYSHASLKSGVFGNDYIWHEGNDAIDSATNQVDTISGDPSATGTYWPLLATLYMGNRNVPVGWVPCPKGATAISSWLPGADHQDRATLYGSMVYRAQQVGGVKAILFHQGESDAVINGFTGYTAYKSRLHTFVEAVWADLGVPVVAALIHKWDDAPSTTQSNVDAIHQAIIDEAATNPHLIVGPNFDNPTRVTGGLHFSTTAHMQDAANRWAPLLYGLDDSIPPTVTGSTVNDVVSRMTVNVSEKVTSAGLANEWIVMAGGQSHAVESVVLAPDGLSITLVVAGAVSQADSVKLSYIGTSLTDVANNPLLTFSDADVTNNSAEARNGGSFVWIG
ncbi:MAG TPA: sialate O-acetylesterase [Abditibacteriaceae bacterium]|jgi:hypothetical protein